MHLQYFYMTEESGYLKDTKTSSSKNCGLKGKYLSMGNYKDKCDSKFEKKSQEGEYDLTALKLVIPSYKLGDCSVQA